MTPSEPLWAKPGLGAYMLTIFGVAYLIAFLVGDKVSLALMTGASIAMTQQVASYYFGSSVSSTSKDATIERMSAGRSIEIIKDPS
jgi:hypothetical protein